MMCVEIVVGMCVDGKIETYLIIRSNQTVRLLIQLGVSFGDTIKFDYFSLTHA